MAKSQTQLTVKQKALAEKTIKLKYNGAINALKSTLTTVEVDNPELKHTNYNDNTNIENHYPPAIKKLHDKLLLAKQAFNEALDAENERRKNNRLEAGKARLLLVTQLQLERDNTILDIAFRGEGDEMLEFLGSLPTPEILTNRLISLGFKPSKELSTITGVGEHNPKGLYSNSYSNIETEL